MLMARRDFFKKTQQTSYKHRPYRNPHLKDQPRLMNWKVILSLALFLGVCIALTIFFLVHPWFDIAYVEIRGIEHIDREQLEETILDSLHEKVLFIFDRSNRFLFSPTKLIEKMKQSFALASASVGLQGDRLFVSIEERTSNLIWKTQDKTYIVDLEGVVVREVASVSDVSELEAPFNILPIFIDKNNVPVTIGSRILTEDEILNVFLFLKLLKEKQMEYVYTEVDRLAGKWMRLVMVDGYGILFDASGDIEKQYRNLEVVLTNEIVDVSTIEYIDLRFGDKVYYK